MRSVKKRGPKHVGDYSKQQNPSLRVTGLNSVAKPQRNMTRGTSLLRMRGSIRTAVSNENGNAQMTCRQGKTGKMVRSRNTVSSLLTGHAQEKAGTAGRPITK